MVVDMRVVDVSEARAPRNKLKALDPAGGRRCGCRTRLGYFTFLFLFHVHLLFLLLKGRTGEKEEE
jgi:hypothetical protein